MLDTTSLDLSPGNFLRPPDWRWRLILHVSATRKRIHFQDEWIQKGSRYLKSYHRCKNDDELALINRKYSPISESLAIYSKEDTFFRATLEAWLLTGLPLNEVAEKANCPVATVEAYHAFFLDVQSRLKVRSFILHQVIGPKIQELFQRQDRSVLLKYFAFHGGSLVLEAALRYFQNPPLLPTNLNDLTSEEIGDLRERYLIKAAITAHFLPPNIEKATFWQHILRDAVQVFGYRPSLASEVFQIPPPFLKIDMNELTKGKKRGRSTPFCPTRQRRKAIGAA